MTLRLPRLASNFAIADANGKPTDAFIRWWQSMAQQIEGGASTTAGLTTYFDAAILENGATSAAEIAAISAEGKAALDRATEAVAAALASAIITEATSRADALLAEAEARGTAITTETTLRTDADAALAELIVSITSSGDTSSGAIEAEQSARASADAAEVTARETLATQLRGSYTGTDTALVTSGVIYSERLARSTADGTLTESISVLSSTVTTNATTAVALITDEASARAYADSAEATERTLLAASIAPAITAAVLVESNARASAISSEATTRTALIAAAVSTVSTNPALMNSQIAGVNLLYSTAASGSSAGPGVYGVTIENIMTATSNPHRISAGQVLTFQTEVSHDATAHAAGQYAVMYLYCADSAGTWLYSATVSSNQAGNFKSGSNSLTVPAGTVTIGLGLFHTGSPGAGTVYSAKTKVEFGSNASLYSAGSAAFADVTANNTAADTAKVGGVNSATIINDLASNANANSANASSISSLSTTVNGYSSSISTVQSSVNGLNSRYGVALDTNGYVSGFSQNNGGGTSNFTILADSFKIVQPGSTPTTVFEVSGGVTRIKQIAIGDGNVATGNIANQAVSNVLSVSATSSISMVNGAGYTASGASLVLSSPAGVNTLILISAICTAGSGFPLYQLVRVQSGARTVLRTGMGASNNTSFVIDIPSSGVTATYILEFAAAGGGSATYSGTATQSIMSMELKR